MAVIRQTHRLLECFFAKGNLVIGAPQNFIIFELKTAHSSHDYPDVFVFENLEDLLTINGAVKVAVTDLTPALRSRKRYTQLQEYVARFGLLAFNGLGLDLSPSGWFDFFGLLVIRLNSSMQARLILAI